MIDPHTLADWSALTRRERVSFVALAIAGLPFFGLTLLLTIVSHAAGVLAELPLDLFWWAATLVLVPADQRQPRYGRYRV